MPTASGNSGDPGIAISVNGNLPFYDNFLQDGASTNLPISANVDIATFETIQELQISTSTFSAQYGIGGAVFNQITKSGSNSWHGAGYEYFQSDQLKADSYNFSSTPQPKPFLRYDNYGAAVGGPSSRTSCSFISILTGFMTTVAVLSQKPQASQRWPCGTAISRACH